MFFGVRQVCLHLCITWVRSDKPARASGQERTYIKMLKGILILVAVFAVYVIGILCLNAVIWGEREGIVKTDNVGEGDENKDDI